MSMASTLSTLPSSSPACYPRPSPPCRLHVQLCLLLLCLFPLTRAFSSSSSSSSSSVPPPPPFFSSSSSVPSNATNSSVPFCSTPHPLFADPVNIFFNRTFPTASTLQPFPAASFLHHCPNLNSSVGSCCDDRSMRFAESVVDAYLDRRNRLSDGLAQLTLADLYYALTGAARTNGTAAHSDTAALNLTAQQRASLSTMMEVVQLWGVGAVNCSDHWMSYLTSTFCLACDPLPRYFTDPPDSHSRPWLHLQSSACSSIYSHCSALFIDFFQRLPQLLALLQAWPAATPAGYNTSAAWWASYDGALTAVASLARVELSIDACSVFDGHHSRTDCQQLFCDGSADVYGLYYPHAFRGLQYGVDSRTLHFLLDAHAYIANMVCTLRLAFNATGFYGEHKYEERTDGCPVSANLLNLLFPRQFAVTPVRSSSCVDEYYHVPTEADVDSCALPPPRWCAWRQQPHHTAVDPAALTRDWPHVGRLNASAAADDSYSDDEYDELCDTNGLTWPAWHNTTDVEVAWPAYEVGCRLNLSRHICQLPPLPLPPPAAIVEVVDELLRRLFIVTVAVGCTVLLCVLACLCRRYRVERVERLEAQVADERSGGEMEVEWEEALMVGKRQHAGGGVVDSAGLATFESPRSGRLWSNEWQ